MRAHVLHDCEFCMHCEQRIKTFIIWHRQSSVWEYQTTSGQTRQPPPIGFQICVRLRWRCRRVNNTRRGCRGHNMLPAVLFVAYLRVSHGELMMIAHVTRPGNRVPASTTTKTAFCRIYVLHICVVQHKRYYYICMYVLLPCIWEMPFYLVSSCCCPVLLSVCLLLGGFCGCFRVTIWYFYTYALNGSDRLGVRIYMNRLRACAAGEDIKWPVCRIPWIWSGMERQTTTTNDKTSPAIPHNTTSKVCVCVNVYVQAYMLYADLRCSRCVCERRRESVLRMIYWQT